VLRSQLASSEADLLHTASRRAGSQLPYSPPDPHVSTSHSIASSVVTTPCNSEPHSSFDLIFTACSHHNPYKLPSCTEAQRPTPQAGPKPRSLANPPAASLLYRTVAYQVDVHPDPAGMLALRPGMSGALPIWACLGSARPALIPFSTPLPAPLHDHFPLKAGIYIFWDTLP
jgi:hypothetical protein